MKSRDIVKSINDEARAGTFFIAEGFGRRHDNVIKHVEEYREIFESMETSSASTVAKDIPRNKVTTAGRGVNEYLLNETQAIFLGTLFRTSSKKPDDPVLLFKARLAKEFVKCRRELRFALNQKGDPIYDQARLTAKTLRKLETGEIQKFIKYAKEQGGTEKGCNMYYANITKMMNGLLFICEGKFKNLRNILTPEQLMTVGSAEQVIAKSLKDDMEKKVFYKDIYQNVKTKVEIFAELHGQSEVISEQLKLSA